MFTYLPANSNAHSVFALVGPNAALLIETSVSSEVLLGLWRSLRKLATEDLLSKLQTLTVGDPGDFALFALTPEVTGSSVAESYSKVTSTVPNDEQLITLTVSGQGRAVIDDAPAFISSGRVATTKARPGDCNNILLTFDSVGDSGEADTFGGSNGELPIIEGIVRCSGIMWQPAPTATSVKSEEAKAPENTLESEPGLQRAQPRPENSQPQPARDDQSTNPFDHLFEHTQFFNVEGAAVRQSEEEVHEAEVAPASSHAPAGFALALPDGSTCSLDRPILIGRRPTVAADSDVRDFRLVKLDGHGSLSRMHLRLDPHKGGAMVTDLGSTNGTMLVSSGAPPKQLQPNLPQFVKEGDQLRLGNSFVCHLTLEV